MPLLNECKPLLRISLYNVAFDDEIEGLIQAARMDLKLSGVLDSKAESDTDPLIKRAVFCYVKAHFGWDNPDAEKLQRSYDMLKTHLTLSQEYTVGTEVDPDAIP